MRRSLLAAVLLGASSAGGVKAPPVARPGVPVRVAVDTSRGDYQLLVYAPAPGTEGTRPAGRGKTPLVLLVSGEGGWRSFDALLARILSEAGCWVGGVDALKYFWAPQDDRQTLSADFRSFADGLAKASGRKPRAPIILAGFSFGADLAPFLAASGGWDGRIRGLLMIAPDEVGSLEFRIADLLGFEPTDHSFRVGEALRGLRGTPVLLIHGENDSGSAAPRLLGQTPSRKKLSVVPGANHHFSGQEGALRRVLSEGMVWLLQGADR